MPCKDSNFSLACLLSSRDSRVLGVNSMALNVTAVWSNVFCGVVSSLMVDSTLFGFNLLVRGRGMTGLLTLSGDVHVGKVSWLIIRFD